MITPLEQRQALRAAPGELLGVYAKHCPLGHVMAIEATACVICATFADFEIEDRKGEGSGSRTGRDDASR